MDIHPTIMKGIRPPSSRSQPTPDRFDVIDPNIEQEARDSQDKRNQDVLLNSHKENYSTQVVDQSFLAEKQKFMEEKRMFMEEQKRMMEEQKRMMEEQKQFLAEKQKMMEEQKQLMGYKANHQPRQPAQQAGASEFDSLKESGLIALSGDDVEVIKNQITEDGNNKITSFIWFYAPWCGFCTRIISTMDEVGRAMKQHSDKVKIYMINGDNKPAIMSTFNVRGFPTLNAYHGQYGVPTPYSGDRSANDIITFLKTEMNK